MDRVRVDLSRIDRCTSPPNSTRQPINSSTSCSEPRRSKPSWPGAKLDKAAGETLARRQAIRSSFTHGTTTCPDSAQNQIATRRQGHGGTGHNHATADRSGHTRRHRTRRPTPSGPCRLCDDCHGGSPTDCRRPGSHGPPLATRYRAVSLAFDVRRRRLTSELQHRVQPFSRRGPGRWFRDGYDQRTRGDLSYLPVQLHVRLRQVYQPRDPGIGGGGLVRGRERRRPPIATDSANRHRDGAEGRGLHQRAGQPGPARSRVLDTADFFPKRRLGELYDRALRCDRALSVALSSSAAGATRVTYTVEFTTSATGALARVRG